MSRQQRDAIASPGGWLTTVAGRICLDLPSSPRVRRETYVGEWIPEPATYTSGSRTASLYLNGTSIGSAALAFTPWHAEGPMTLGTAMTGTLDEVWVHGRELLADEVFALMDGSSAGG